ncbi:hypothetical protein C4D60_Mb01t10470 [Musa balbisiana]|uniref:Pterin-binding domain-containing protein n=1 Tax=Musa balbisiana TaxID=52838 RepID=A0A4S8JL85_MUSBA|nr:hypothetical protein C4D60_Mb01t10470 [Musa balbisiana]
MARSLLSPMPSSPRFSIYRRLALLPCRFVGISTARWILGAAVILAVPFYRRFLKIEGEVKKTTKAAVGVVEKVAEVTEKIAMEVAEALPENTKLKQVALEVEEIAEVVDKEAKLAETILEEVDDVVEKVDTLVEPIVDEFEGKDSKENI